MSDTEQTSEAAEPHEEVRIIARCVFCKHEADVGTPRDVPMCPKCFSPMVAFAATAVQR